MVADLDHFKRINDGFGHATGDLTLRAFVEVCHGALRDSDAVGQLGGEEFGIVLYGVELAQASGIAECIRQQFRATAATRLPQRISASVSMGLAAQRAGETRELILMRADRALYTAKALGCDRVCLARRRGRADHRARHRWLALSETTRHAGAAKLDPFILGRQGEGGHMKGNLVIVCRDQDALEFDTLMAEYGALQTRLSSTAWYLKLKDAPEMIQEKILAQLGKYTTHYIFEASTVTYNTVDSDAAAALNALFAE